MKNGENGGFSYAGIRKIINSLAQSVALLQNVSKFELKMMNFAFEMMDSVLKMPNFGRWSGFHSSRFIYSRSLA